MNADKWSKLADEKTLQKAVDSLKKNGIEVFVVENGEEAKKKVLSLIPEGAEVYNNQSATLDSIGVTQEIMESGKYRALKKIITSENDEAKRHELRRKSSIADFFVGSVHAVTENGELVVASNSGSQIPAISASSPHVILVVGTQKIVKNLDEAFKRIYEYSLPLESERLKKVAGIPSNVSKILIINKEIVPGRIKLIFVKENLGF